MKFSLILLLLFSVFSHAEEYKEYKRGVWVCTDESEEIFKHDSADLDNRYLYASCLVIKGLDSQGPAPALYFV